jgi:hypothetical protein
MQRTGEAIRQHVPTALSAHSKMPSMASVSVLFSVSFKHKPTYTVSGKHRASFLQAGERSGTAQCSTVQHSTAQCSTVQHSATQCNTVQHSTVHCLKQENRITLYSICNPNCCQQILSFLAHSCHEKKKSFNKYRLTDV